MRQRGVDCVVKEFLFCFLFFVLFLFLLFYFFYFFAFSRFQCFFKRECMYVKLGVEKDDREAAALIFNLTAGWRSTAAAAAAAAAMAAASETYEFELRPRSRYRIV